jgi:hypothetical protein
MQQPNDGLQLRRAISIQAEGKELLEKHAIAPAAARLCFMKGCQEKKQSYLLAVLSLTPAHNHTRKLATHAARVLFFHPHLSNS